MRNSFRTQLLINLCGVLLILAASAGYILYSTIRLQELAGASFERQRDLKRLQGELDAFQPPFLEYLSSKSSNALAELLIRSQRIHGLIPAYAAIPADPDALAEKEVHSLVGAYLDLADAVIEEKRGMDVARYTSLFEQIERLLGYIRDRIERLSGTRFDTQFAEYESFIASSRSVQSWNLLFIAAAALFSLLLLLRAVDKINRPMVKLSESAAELASGNFEIDDIVLTSLYEIDQVVDAFNRMKRDIHTNIRELEWQRHVEQEYLHEKMRNLAMERTVRAMELYTLQAQMNPHFLFNTLNTGVQLAIVEGAERTGEYMQRLTKLLRHNLRERDAVVPLRHEIEGLEAYFYILGVRFPKNLDLALDYPAELLDSHQVPASILQPLVENCVVHAFKDRPGLNSIVVRVYLDGARLCLSVADSGVGMTAETAAALLKPDPAAGPRAKAMGLENVIRRLQFFYPDDPEVVAIKSRPGEGTEVLIRLDTGRPICLAS
jgi:signal transduction histidine kinase